MSAAAQAEARRAPAPADHLGGRLRHHRAEGDEPGERRCGRPAAALRPVRVLALVHALALTAVEMVRGSWRTARFCLRGDGSPGYVEIPREGRSRYAVALWGVLTGEAPDEVPVDIDDARDVLIVHLIDASDPDAVRERHRRAYERAQRKAVP
jgi:multisubunit Na+/H+ antiporter MnhE subunit